MHTSLTTLENLDKLMADWKGMAGPEERQVEKNRLKELWLQIE